MRVGSNRIAAFIEHWLKVKVSEKKSDYAIYSISKSAGVDGTDLPETRIIITHTFFLWGV